MAYLPYCMKLVTLSGVQDEGVDALVKASTHQKE